jgi:hypothetical protein
MNFENPLDLINSVLEERFEWASKILLDGQISSPIPKALSKRLLEERQISGPIFYISETKAKSIITSEKLDTFPELVEYERDEKNSWQITSIKQRCLGCFGSGILSEIEICSVCSGEGWTES